mmetsp:Transcript_37552/g.119657  ORF Transcript_37552/g.119657 Transcript_37552/m.119657 type:complete len:703 (-) Transcript_37552:96-2204(-)
MGQTNRSPPSALAPAAAELGMGGGHVVDEVRGDAGGSSSSSMGRGPALGRGSDWRQRGIALAKGGASQKRVVQLDLVDTSGSDSWKPLKSIGPFERDLELLSIQIRWHDQGWGSQKSRIRAVLRRGSRILAKVDVFGHAPHECEDRKNEFTNFDGIKAEAGDVIQFEYLVGSGGGSLTGHELHIEKMKVAYTIATEQSISEASASAAVQSDASILSGVGLAGLGGGSELRSKPPPLVAFLTYVGLEQYAGKFAALGFATMDALLNMTEEVMRSALGIRTDHMLVLKVAIAELRTAAAAAGPFEQQRHQAPGMGDAEAPVGNGRLGAGGGAGSVVISFAAHLPEAPILEGLVGAASLSTAIAWLARHLEGERQNLFERAHSALEGQAGVPDATLFQLAKTAEEAAQLCSTVMDQCVAGVDGDRDQLISFVLEAEEAAQRATWAASAAQNREVAASAAPHETLSQHKGFLPIGGDLLIESMTVQEAKVRCMTLTGCKGFSFKGPPASEAVQVYFKDKWDLCSAGPVVWTSFKFQLVPEAEEWFSAMKEIAKQAAEVASRCVRECKAVMGGGVSSISQLIHDKSTSKVPCRFYQQGRCSNGFTCQFSHEDNGQRPITMKMDKPCVFFARGHCARGSECPFAHGDEELKLISAVRTARRGQKRGLLEEDPWPEHTAAAFAAGIGGEGPPRKSERKPRSMPQATPWY